MKTVTKFRPSVPLRKRCDDSQGNFRGSKRIVVTIYSTKTNQGSSLRLHLHSQVSHMGMYSSV